MKTPDLSIIIPVFNKAAVIARTVDSVCSQDIEHNRLELIVVDDGSTDGSRQILHQLQPGIEYRIIDQGNRGAAAARNVGAAIATGCVLFFLDSDIILAPNALREHLEAHDKCQRALIATRIIPFAAGNSATEEDMPFQRVFDLGPTNRCISWARTTTQGLSTKKSHFDEIGPFSTSLRRGQDIEFAYRALQKGLEIRHWPRAIGYHDHTLTMRQRCDTEKRNQAYLTLFFRQYPHLRGEMPHLQDKWPISWTDDSPTLIGRKLMRRVLISPPILWSMETCWRLLSRHNSVPSMRESLAWKIVGSYQLMGICEGLAQYWPGYPNPDSGRNRTSQ